MKTKLSDLRYRAVLYFKIITTITNFSFHDLVGQLKSTYYPFREWSVRVYMYASGPYKIGHIYDLKAVFLIQQKVVAKHKEHHFYDYSDIAAIEPYTRIFINTA